MIPYVPILVITSHDVYQGAAYEDGDVCVFIAPKEIKEATLALVDLAVLINQRYEFVEEEGMRFPVGTIYACKCHVEKVLRHKSLGLHIGRVEKRWGLERLEDALLLKELSIPVKIGDFLTRADERYISRL